MLLALISILIVLMSLEVLMALWIIVVSACSIWVWLSLIWIEHSWITELILLLLISNILLLLVIRCVLDSWILLRIPHIGSLIWNTSIWGRRYSLPSDRLIWHRLIWTLRPRMMWISHYRIIQIILYHRHWLNISEIWIVSLKVSIHIHWSIIIHTA